MTAKHKQICLRAASVFLAGMGGALRDAWIVILEDGSSAEERDAIAAYIEEIAKSLEKQLKKLAKATRGAK